MGDRVHLGRASAPASPVASSSGGGTGWAVSSILHPRILAGLVGLLVVAAVVLISIRVGLGAQSFQDLWERLVSLD